MASGYYGGYLQALSMVSGVESQLVQREQARQNMEIQQRAIQIDDQERSILSQVFKQQAIQQGEDGMMQANNDLSQQYMQAGQALMGINPKTGMKLLEDGGQLQTRNQQLQIGKIKTEAAKNKLIGAIAGSVRDQVSLDEARDKIARLGIAIPKQFGEWNENTGMYMESLRDAAVPASQQAQLQARASELLIKDRAEQRKAEVMEIQKQRKASDAVQKRDRGFSREIDSAIGEKGKTAKETQMGILATEGVEETAWWKTNNTWFKDLPTATQEKAALEVRTKAYEIMKDKEPGEEIEASEALEQARSLVLQKYNPKNKDKKEPETKQKKSMSFVGEKNGVQFYRLPNGQLVKKAK